MNEYEILLEELDKICDKWRQRLNYQGTQGKDSFDCLLCSTVMYEIERAKMSCSARIRDNNEKALEEKTNHQKEGK